MVAWYASVGVTVIKRRETAVLLEYNPGETRVLQAESVPETTARRVAVNAVIRPYEPRIARTAERRLLLRRDER